MTTLVGIVLLAALTVRVLRDGLLIPFIVARDARA
jgi:hypothetical protein